MDLELSNSAPNGDAKFDIVATYNSLLTTDPELTMPVAAIESLVQALSVHHTSTISETLQYLRSQSSLLIASTANPISLSAGTDLFQRYLASSLGNPRGDDQEPEFEAVRSHLLHNGRLFVQRAKASRETIASFGRHFVRDGSTVLTAGGSRVVGALLREAAQAGGPSVRFKVIYVLSQPSSASVRGEKNIPEGADIVRSLREHGVPVATIAEGSVGYALSLVDMIIVGAEGVVENGGAISRLGTYQLGILAKSANKPFYVVAESHKFVRLFPLGQYDLPIDQRVIEFKIDGETVVDSGPRRSDMIENINLHDIKAAPKSPNGPKDAVDFTAPELISGIITESGVITPSAVSEELIKIWL